MANETIENEETLEDKVDETTAAQKLEEKAMRNISKEDLQLFQKIFLQMYHNLEKGEDSDESGESKR